MNCEAKYSFEMRYLLRAHSPRIHFQYNQVGSTLRATEVKPSLDRFLVKKTGKSNMPKSWFIDKDGRGVALKYKLRFEPYGEQKIVKIGAKTAYNIYFGNAQLGRAVKKGILGDAVMRVICMDADLRNLIDEYIGEFFITHNFGTMQSKGFGSYTVEGKKTDTVASILKKTFGAEKCFCFDGAGSPFLGIKNVYSIIKSGINNQGYQRSLLFLYMHERFAIGNEKAWLKKSGHAPSDVGANCNMTPEDGDCRYHFVRALLGLSDHLEFLNDLKNTSDRTKIKIQSKAKNKKDIIYRLPSPIFFKVIDGMVYFVAKRIPNAIYGAEFEFMDTKKINDREWRDQSIGTLTVPSKEELGEDFIDRFMDYCKEQFDKGVLENTRFTKGIVIREEV